MISFFEFIKPHKRLYIRFGRIIFYLNVINTPKFVFCATNAFIKSLDSFQVLDINIHTLLSNTYHLMKSPGARLVCFSGGLHKFMNWKKSILTDSGGFQIFSLIKNNIYLFKYFENGIFSLFYYKIKYFLTPETSLQIQRNLFTDILISFDKCINFNKKKKYTKKTMHISFRWSLRSYLEYQKFFCSIQVLYIIIQGGIYSDLRLENFSISRSKKFFGYAIGGTIGNNLYQMLNMIFLTKKNIFYSNSIHLLGIGKFIDVFESIKLGIDTLDCVHITRISRHGSILSFYDCNLMQYFNLSNIKCTFNTNSIDKDCDCCACINFSFNYIQHLMRMNESIAVRLILVHNIFFFNKLLIKVCFYIKNNFFL